MATGRPELAAVLATDRLETAAEALEHLRLRSGEVRLELVLVGIAGTVVAEPAADGFAAVRTLTVPETALGAARAAGVRAAQAPLVVLVETHCFPEPGWARALVQRWEEGWGVIGPSIDIENPSPRSWTSLLLDYGPLLERRPGPRRHVPGHNSAYDRDLLLNGEIDLEAALEDETLLHWRFADAGRSPYLDDRARARHMNITQLRAAATQWFHHSRLFAARRAAGWGLVRRALYVVGSPLLTILFAARTLGDAHRLGHLADVARSAPFMLACCAARSAGELAGYLTLRGDAAATNRYELHRVDYADRSGGRGRALAGAPS
jgi:hypothetical protein